MLEPRRRHGIVIGKQPDDLTHGSSGEVSDCVLGDFIPRSSNSHKFWGFVVLVVVIVSIDSGCVT